MITESVFGKHIKLPPIKMDFDSYSVMHAVMAQIITSHDEAIYKAIVNYAIQYGITDIYLLDEEFVRTALINEAKRRKGGAQ